MGFYTRVVRPVAFRGDAERMHDLAIRTAERVSASQMLCDALATRYVRAYPRLECTVAGEHFANPIGLAAGYDKNGRATPFWATLGFGHIEIGSVSAWPSKGNPKPRLWRIPEDQGLVVNYGLPNDGAEPIAARIADAQTPVPLGLNIVNTNYGADSATSNDDEIIEDYVHSIRLLTAHARYLMLNLSCPNTADGRAFVCDSHRVRQLLSAVREAAPSQPVFLKVATFSDSRSLDRFLEQVDAVPFVRGFGINLPPGKAVPLRTAPDRYARCPEPCPSCPAGP
jgi:dihydroorotate dehydrogenase (fumarate)/dihydroorotate dehydrogenase